MKNILKAGLVTIVALLLVTATRSTVACPDGEVPDCSYSDGVNFTFFKHPNDCHWFFHCSNGVAYCMKCPADLHWNVELETCDYPSRAGCDEGCDLCGAHVVMDCKWTETTWGVDVQGNKYVIDRVTKSCKKCAYTCNFEKKGNCQQPRLCPTDSETIV